MILDGGDGLFKPSTIRLFASSASPPGEKNVRGLGWDIDSVYSGNRGNLFPAGRSFGHTGFTGTSIWIDPASKTYVILLANAVHPHAGAAITPLRRAVATIAAASVGYSNTLTGLDVLVADNFSELRGKKVGLITNQTGVNREGKRNVDLMVKAGVNVVALFSPEHGFAGVEDRPGIANATDPATGLRIWSLYGSTTRPTPQMLAGIDTLVFDIQDVGVRFYTYDALMLYAMEEAAKEKISFYVLDRPDPLTGSRVEGPMLDPDKVSFARSISSAAALRPHHRRTGAPRKRRIIPGRGSSCGGHDRLEARPVVRFDRTALAQSLAEYPQSDRGNPLSGAGDAGAFHELFSGARNRSAIRTNRGGLDPMAPNLAKYLDPQREIPGVAFRPVDFTPASSNLSGKKVHGIRISLTDRDLFAATRFGVELALALGQTLPRQNELGTE